ncbi:MAG: cell division protein FtsQ/DivIB [Streptosporangiaceae bacterium]
MRRPGRSGRGRSGRRSGGERGRRDPWKAAFFGLAAVALAAGVTWALLGSSFLVVRTVRTTGSAVPRSAVLNAAGVRMGTPLIRIDTGAVARRVERIRQVQVARVTLSWPDGLVIWTKRRTATFALADAGGYDVLDSYGVVLRRSVTTPRGLLPIRLTTSQAGASQGAGQTGAGQTGPGQTGPPGAVASLRQNPAVLAAGAVVRTLPSWLRNRVRQVRAGGPADVILVLRGGSTVRWGGPAHPAAKAAEVAILLRTRARYVDVSDPTTAVTGSSASVPSPSPSRG